jgi:hypothetical protein
MRVRKDRGGKRLRKKQTEGSINKRDRLKRPRKDIPNKESKKLNRNKS